MAPVTSYKKRRRAYEGEEARNQAVLRLKNESNVRFKMKRLSEAHQPVKKDSPQAQQYAAEKARARSNSERLTISHGGAPASPKPFSARKPRFDTTRGKRRLSFREAYSRRTTDTSRARVLDLYGRSAPPKGYADRRIHQPVTNSPISRLPVPTGGTRRMKDPVPSTGGARYSPNTLRDAVVKMRRNTVGTGRRRRGRRPPTYGSPRGGTRKLF